MTSEPTAEPGGDSARIEQALLRAEERQQRAGDRLRPVTWLLLAVVAGGGLSSARHPPGLSGLNLCAGLALSTYLLVLAASATGRWPDHNLSGEISLMLVLGVSGIALAALQTDGPLSEIPVSAAVMITFFRLPRRPALLIGGATTAALAVVIVRGEHRSVAAALANVLLCVVLAVTAELVRRGHTNQTRVELLLAELEDARDRETAAAAVAERSRIARELHDVLAQSLSALAIQLEGARKLAERDAVGPQLQGIITRSVELTREGLTEARRAVGALRGDALPTIEQLPDLVDRAREDLALDVTLSVQGAPRQLAAEVGFAFYRGAQEALTNAARYAPGAVTAVRLQYQDDRVRLAVQNAGGGAAVVPGSGPPGTGGPGSGSPGTVAPGVWKGGGSGLGGMAERLERVGGTVHAGPTSDGWLVTMEVTQ